MKMNKNKNTEQSDTIKDMQSCMTDWRRWLHQWPAPGFEEYVAADFIKERLDEWKVTYRCGYGKTGIVATVQGEYGDHTAPHIALRADIDSIIINEESRQPWASCNEGYMHGCGHDGHMVMLLGAIKYLRDHPDFAGTVHFIFQPAEEPLEGARAMIKDGLLEDFRIDAFYGMHNWPWLPRGRFGIRTGPFMAATSHFRIMIAGKGGHSAMPQDTVDPVLIGCEINTTLQSLVSRNTDPLESAVINFPVFKTGSADDIIPHTVELAGAIRTFNAALHSRLEQRLKEVCSYIAAAHGGTAQVEYLSDSDALINDEQQVDNVYQVAMSLVGNENIYTQHPPSLAGEDFGTFSHYRPSAYIFIGQGEPDDPDSPHSQGLHSPLYDFNDAILPLGADYWVRLVHHVLPASRQDQDET